MATEKQFEANRQNAQKSTGPKTPEGRAAVRVNGVKHGLTAETIVLKGESEADFHRHARFLRSRARPHHSNRRSTSSPVSPSQLATPTPLPSGSRFLHLPTAKSRRHAKGSQAG